MTRRIISIVFLIFFASAASAIAAPPPLWIDVPFVAQDKDGCGAAAISMVMQYWENRPGQSLSVRAAPGRIEAVLNPRAGGGIAASEMEGYFRASGYQVFAFRADWSDLLHHLQAGRPLIVSLEASGALGPLHYVVVVGIDAERGFVYLNDPASHKLLRISREGFESEWNPTHDWTLLALPHPGN